MVRYCRVLLSFGVVCKNGVLVHLLLHFARQMHEVRLVKGVSKRLVVLRLLSMCNATVRPNVRSRLPRALNRLLRKGVHFVGVQISVVSCVTLLNVEYVVIERTSRQDHLIVHELLGPEMLFVELLSNKSLRCALAARCSDVIVYCTLGTV